MIDVDANPMILLLTSPRSSRMRRAMRSAVAAATMATAAMEATSTVQATAEPV